MKLKITIVTAIIAFIIICTISFLKVLAAKNQLDQNYLSFCQELSQSSYNAQNWYFIIYLDVEACLSCNEHIESWVELEQVLPQYGGQLYIFTNQRDSIDVAIAMKLEGINSDVKILDDSWLEQLGLLDKRTPIKILFDNSCKPLIIESAFGNKKIAEIFYKQLIEEIKFIDEK